MREIVLCTTLTDHSLDLMKELKGSPLLDDARIHIVHCFEIQVYTNEFSPYIYPTEDNKDLLQVKDNIGTCFSFETQEIPCSEKDGIVNIPLQ